MGNMFGPKTPTDVLEVPWRKIGEKGWTKEEEERLIEEIGKVRADGVEKPKILLLGQVKSGKTSFINSVHSINAGGISVVALAGLREESMTRKLHHYEPRGGKFPGNFILMDVMGMHEYGGLLPSDIQKLIDGNVRDKYQFDTYIPISPENENFYKAVVGLSDMVHCTVFVMEADLIASDQLTKQFLDNLRKIYISLLEKNQRFVLLLTKIDELSPIVRRSTKTVFQSRWIRQVVEKAHRLLGIPEMQIFPVRNYSKEIELETEMNILILLALRLIVRSARDRINYM